MSGRRKPDGRYTVSGPLEEDKPVPNVGAGISVAQMFACRRLELDGEEFSYYVRDLLGTAHARVTKRGDERAVETYVLTN
jgi:hypothetical protein